MSSADTITRIAMWSGPRNISTAMLRAFENRGDTVVVDEPLYAHYLTQVSIEHPGRDEIIAHDETDWRKVVAKLLGPLPPGKRVFYQKHMAHHLLPWIDRAWLDRAVNVFLIREPEAMLTSLIKKIPEPGVEDTGLPQQVELFERVRERSGKTPPVLDAKDVLLDPRGMLAALCEAVGIPFDEGMLSWPAGPRDSDGIWAKYWYAEVEKSTGFQPYREKDERVPDGLRGVLATCREHYATLHAARLHV